MLELIKAISNGAEVSVVLPEKGQIEQLLMDKGIATEIIDIPWWVRNDVIAVGSRRYSRVTKSLSDLDSYLERFRPDVCITNTSVIPWGAVAARQKGVPHIWYIHEMIDEQSEIKYEAELDLVTRMIDQLSDVVIANSEYCRDVLQRDIVPEKMLTIAPVLHLPDLDEVSSQDVPDLYTKIRSDSSIPIILIPARIIDGKGQLDAVKAIRVLHEKKRDFQLVLLGTSEPIYRKKIESYVTRHRISHLVHIHPFVEDPRPYIVFADILLNTSRLESFGRSTIEAMYARTPVIGANNTAISHMISNGSNGLLYETGDVAGLAERILLITDDSNVRKKIIMGGRRYASATLTQTKKAFSTLPGVLNDIANTRHEPDLALTYLWKTLDTKTDNVRISDSTATPRRDGVSYKMIRILKKVGRRVRRYI